MRISDWSSDVCSSDLTLDAFRFLMSAGNVPLVVAGLDVARQIFADDVELAYRSIILKLPLWEPGEPAQRLIRALARGMGMEAPDHLAAPAARKSVVSGKRVQVQVDPGGSRIHK